MSGWCCSPLLHSRLFLYKSTQSVSHRDPKVASINYLFLSAVTPSHKRKHKLLNPYKTKKSLRGQQTVTLPRLTSFPCQGVTHYFSPHPNHSIKGGRGPLFYSKPINIIKFIE